MAQAQAVSRDARRGDRHKTRSYQTPQVAKACFQIAGRAEHPTRPYVRTSQISLIPPLHYFSVVTRKLCSPGRSAAFSPVAGKVLAPPKPKRTRLWIGKR